MSDETIYIVPFTILVVPDIILQCTFIHENYPTVDQLFLLAII